MHKQQQTVQSASHSSLLPPNSSKVASTRSEVPTPKVASKSSWLKAWPSDEEAWVIKSLYMKRGIENFARDEDGDCYRLWTDHVGFKA
mmetsp:Transcript_45000/g.106988  ORF Transcript_45000/g.106988 Transcript_45000/m.106988 type:complete len:88 (+) Transcript_45000:1205-1468(+)